MLLQTLYSEFLSVDFFLELVLGVFQVGDVLHVTMLLAALVLEDLFELLEAILFEVELSL